MRISNNYLTTGVLLDKFSLPRIRVRQWISKKKMVLAVMAAIASFYFFDGCIRMRLRAEAGSFSHGNEPPRRSPFGSEAVVTVLASCLFESLLFYIVMPATYQWYMGNLEQSIKGQKRVEWATKAALTVNQFIKSTIFTVWGAWALWNQPFMPHWLGGAMEVQEQWFEGVPNQYDCYPTHRYFYVAMAMRYILDFVYLPMRKRTLKGDFKMIVIHHIVTIHLIAGSYITDYVGAGASVMHLHNISEPFLCLCRLSNKVPQFDRLQGDIVWWVFTTASWGFLRLFVFPVYFLKPLMATCYSMYHGGPCVVGWDNSIDAHEAGHYDVIVVITAICSVLQVMHIQWFTVLVNIGLKAILTGAKEDAISEGEDEGITR